MFGLLRLIPLIITVGGLAAQPLFWLLVIGSFFCMAVSGIYTIVRDGPDLALVNIPENIRVTEVEGPHPSARPRHGLVVTLTIHNTHSYQWTPHLTAETPLWTACLGTGNRVVSMPMDWIMGQDSTPTFPRIGPHSSMAVDFLTKLDWDYEPLGRSEYLHDCKIGGTKSQAMMQLGVDPSDQNRARR